MLAAACGSEPPPAEDEDGSSTTSSDSATSTSTTTTGTTTTTTTTTGPPTTGGADSTTYGPGCGPDPCPAMCDRECDPIATCIASVWTCECECPMTGTEGERCPPLTDQIDLWVEPSKTPDVDCGTVGPGDDAMAWQTVHDCAVLSAQGSAFRALWSQPPGEDPYEYGAAARVGGMYERGWFEASGMGTVIEYGCEAIVATPDCMVDVGQMCLTCEGQTEVAIPCPGK